MASVEKTTSDVRDRMAGMADGMHEMADHAMESFGHGMEKVRDTLQGSVRSARRSMARAEKSLEDTVAERPLLSVGAAFGIGMGIVFGMWALDCFLNRDR